MLWYLVSKTELLAFEPDRANLIKSTETLTNSSGSNRIKRIEKGLWSRDGDFKFNSSCAIPVTANNIFESGGGRGSSTVNGSLRKQFNASLGYM